MGKRVMIGPHRFILTLKILLLWIFFDMRFRKNDHLGLAIFYKQIKFSLVCQDSFIIHERIRELMNRVGIDDKVAKALQDHMREKATYPDLLDPPGCLFSKLRLRENYHTTICIGTTHITWKDFKYPVLQMLQVSLMHPIRACK